MSFMPAMVHKIDPAKVIFEAVGMKKGQLPGFEFIGNRVLVGVYSRPEKTASGIILTEQYREEEKNQGKPCLVLAVGPKAFVDTEDYKFVGQKCEVGDWVTIQVYEARPIVVNGYPCRWLRDSQIVAKIPGPDSVF